MAEAEKKGALTTFLKMSKEKPEKLRTFHFWFCVAFVAHRGPEIWVSPNLFQLALRHYLDVIEGESTFIKMNNGTSS